MFPSHDHGNSLLGVHKSGAAAVGAAAAAVGDKRKSSGEDTRERARVKAEPSGGPTKRERNPYSSSGSDRPFSKQKLRGNTQLPATTQRPRAVTRSFDDIESSVENLPQHTEMSKRAATDGEEVPVIPPPAKLSKIIPDYFTITLPWMHRVVTSTESWFTHDLDRPLALIRLNSIYDPLKQSNPTQTGTADDPLVDADTQPQRS